MRNKQASLLTIALLVLISNWINAANISWTNGNATGIWSDNANWSGGTKPGSGDVAIFDGTSTANCTIDEIINVQGISINSGYTGTITQNTGFTITIGSSGFSQADGVFTGGDSNIDINSGVFSISGGTYTATSAVMFIGNTFGSNVNIFSQTAGIFNHNNGTINIDIDFSGCATRTATLVSTSTQFFNFVADIDDIGCTEDFLSISGSSTGCRSSLRSSPTRTRNCG